MKRLFKLIILVLVVTLFTSLNVVSADTGTDVEKYSLEKLLRNYSLISLGQKTGEGNGTSKIYHLGGQYLVNGKLEGNWNGDLFAPMDNKTDDGVISCTVISSGIVGLNNLGQWNWLGDAPLCSEYNLNFKNLYDNIVKQQKDIWKGFSISDTGSIEISTGGYYTIHNINDIYEIKFSDFEKNENTITVITIEDEGTINMPSTYYINDSNSNNKVITNDEFGGDTNYDITTGESLGNRYHYDDVYYGNIIWSFPNATEITFTGVPFFGHIIAPNADVTMPETNYAGMFIVNSLTAEGFTEAHFYPLTLPLETKDITIKLDCDCEDEDRDSRPASVTIDIFADGKKFDSIELTKENNWTYEYKGLPKSLDGETEIEYTLGGEYIEENSVDVDGFNITIPCVAKGEAQTSNKPATSNSQSELDNPPTLDNVAVFALISIISTILLLIFIKIYYRKNIQ